MKNHFLQVSREGLKWDVTPSFLTKIRKSFHTRHFLKLPGFLEPGLCKELVAKIEKARFYRKVHTGIAVDLCMRENPALRELQFLMNDLELFARIQDLTGCLEIGCFTGRVYKMERGINHDHWHNDLTETRLVALSLNLSPKQYRGGNLWMREQKKGGRQWEVPNPGLGDAVIFRLSQDLMHKVGNVEGEDPKTAFAGWFRAKPHFLAVIKKRRNKKRGPA